jgi:hypothetical protein
MASYANQDYATARARASTYSPTTVGGNMVSSATRGLTDLANKYKDNETIAGLAVGGLGDIFANQAITGNEIERNSAFLADMGRFQIDLDNSRTANASKLMAQEGAIARDLTDMTTGRSLEGAKYVADQTLAGAKYGYDSQERQIGLQGREDRETLGRKTIEEKKLRADARGAIRSQGARFYG